jgi:hypothetical protein
MGHPNRPLRAICHRADVPLISPIGLRHSCETYLEERGTSELFQHDVARAQESAQMLKKPLPAHDHPTETARIAHERALVPEQIFTISAPVAARGGGFLRFAHARTRPMCKGCNVD